MSKLHIFKYPDPNSENTAFIHAWFDIIAELDDSDKKSVLVKAHNYGLVPAWLVADMFNDLDLGDS